LTQVSGDGCISHIEAIIDKETKEVTEKIEGSEQ